MQAYEIAPEIRMTRDMDLIRTLLLWIEAQPQLDGTRWLAPDKPEDVGVSDHSIEEVQYHLNLLIEAGFVEGKSFDAAGTVVFSRLTWKGHEFLENIKDVSVWKQVKARIEGLSGVALTVVAELAKAEIKKRLGLP
jgi:uncharacterized protein DUF2513